jgi:glycolate oxidase FAD binding subunit
VLQYEPRDLTIGVEAGMPFAELQRVLAANGQMVPLEGPWSEEGTVGGLIASNISGSRRRLYGTARDLVIGMQFATMEGKLVDSGGMVVKNVAGLDMAKVLIGSFGTLAAITRVNFKLVPIPAVSRTVLLSFDDLASASAAASGALRNVVTPIAMDLLNPLFGATHGLKGYTLALLFGGNQAVIERSLKIAETMGKVRSLSADEEIKFWSFVRNATPTHMDKFAEGAVVRVATPLSEVKDALASAEHPAMAHVGNGIVRQWFTRPDTASKWLTAAAAKGWKGVMEAAGEGAKSSLELWPASGGDFAIMKQIKHMFDPEGLLNSGRLYGRI